MPKFIDPLTDFGFKRIFANEEHKNITIDFLNSILQLKSPIVSITFQNLEKGGYSKDEKKSIFDIFAKDSEGREIIVELQRADQQFFVDRSIFYTAKQIVNMGVKGSWNYEIQPIYFIAILDFPHFQDEKYIRRVSCKDEENIEITEKLNFVYIEIPKFRKSLEELENFDRWIYFLKHLDSLENRVFNSEPFSDAFEIAYFSNLEGDDRLRYEIDLKERRDKFAVEQFQKNRFELGLEQGKKEEKIAIAKLLLASGDSIEKISQVTQLSEEEIKNLKGE